MIDVRKSKFFFEIKTESKKRLLPIAKMKFVYTMITKKFLSVKTYFYGISLHQSTCFY